MVIVYTSKHFPWQYLVNETRAETPLLKNSFESGTKVACPMKTGQYFVFIHETSSRVFEINRKSIAELTSIMQVHWPITVMDKLDIFNIQDVRSAQDLLTLRKLGFQTRLDYVRNEAEFDEAKTERAYFFPDENGEFRLKMMGKLEEPEKFSDVLPAERKKKPESKSKTSNFIVTKKNGDVFYRCLEIDKDLIKNIRNQRDQ